MIQITIVTMGYCKLEVHETYASTKSVIIGPGNVFFLSWIAPFLCKLPWKNDKILSFKWVHLKCRLINFSILFLASMCLALWHWNRNIPVDLVDTMAVDALAPCVERPWTPMVFDRPLPSTWDYFNWLCHLEKWLKKAMYFNVSWNKFNKTRVKVTCKRKMQPECVQQGITIMCDTEGDASSKFRFAMTLECQVLTLEVTRYFVKSCQILWTTLVGAKQNHPYTKNFCRKLVSSKPTKKNFASGYISNNLVTLHIYICY